MLNTINYDWIEDYCLAMQGVEKEYKAEWDAILYKIGGKFFTMIGNDKEGNDIVSVKLLPEVGIEMREKYEEIKPGYYLNKTHWNSILLNGKVNNDEIKSMLKQSYQLVFVGLTKKLQKEISAESARTS